MGTQLQSHQWPNDHGLGGSGRYYLTIQPPLSENNMFVSLLDDEGILGNEKKKNILNSIWDYPRGLKDWHFKPPQKREKQTDKKRILLSFTHENDLFSWNHFLFLGEKENHEKNEIDWFPMWKNPEASEKINPEKEKNGCHTQHLTSFINEIHLLPKFSKKILLTFYIFQNTFQEKFSH